MSQEFRIVKGRGRQQLALGQKLIHQINLIKLAELRKMSCDLKLFTEHLICFHVIQAIS
jgi:hypothetical protein